MNLIFSFFIRTLPTWVRITAKPKNGRNFGRNIFGGIIFPFRLQTEKRRNRKTAEISAEKYCLLAWDYSGIAIIMRMKNDQTKWKALLSIFISTSMLLIIIWLKSICSREEYFRALRPHIFLYFHQRKMMCFAKFRLFNYSYLSFSSFRVLEKRKGTTILKIKPWRRT